METVVEKLHFSVHGDFVTRFVRDSVLSDEHVHAVDVLRTLEGLPLEDMYKILIGTKKLVGIDYLELEDDNDTEYIESLKCKFGGVVKGSNSSYYRPYAHVRSFGVADYRYSNGSKKHEDRAEYYKYHQTDLVKMLDIKMEDGFTMALVVLFEQVQVPDFIAFEFNIGRDFQKACNEYLERHTLEVIDAEEVRIEPNFRSWSVLEPVKKEIKEEIEEESNPTVTTGDIDYHARTLASFRSGDEIVRQYAWVLPSGDSYECEYMEHMELADLICEEVFGYDARTTIYDGKERPSSDKYLEEIGAIKLGCSLMVGPYVHCCYDSHKLFTQAQLNKVYNWCEDNGIEYPKEMFDELE